MTKRPKGHLHLPYLTPTEPKPGFRFQDLPLIMSGFPWKNRWISMKTGDSPFEMAWTRTKTPFPCQAVFFQDALAELRCFLRRPIATRKHQAAPHYLTFQTIWIDHWQSTARCCLFPSLWRLSRIVRTGSCSIWASRYIHLLNVLWMHWMLKHHPILAPKLLDSGCSMFLDFHQWPHRLGMNLSRWVLVLGTTTQSSVALGRLIRRSHNFYICIEMIWYIDIWICVCATSISRTIFQEF